MKILMTALMIAGFSVLNHTASAEEETHIKFEAPYAFATAENQKAGAVFGILYNKGGDDLKLIAAESDVAETHEIHEMAMTDGVMQMRKLESLTIAAGEHSKLEPTGNHVMLIGLVSPLKEGENFPLALKFEGDKTLTVDVSIVAPGQKPGGSHDHSHHGHGHNHHGHDH